MITETAEVEAALEPLRARGIPVNFQSLVIKGAEAAVDAVQTAAEDDERRRQARERFLERTLTGAGLDLDILADPSRPAWKRPSIDRLLEDES
jgi:hypothetical protein